MRRREWQGLRQHETAQILVGRKALPRPPPPSVLQAPVSPAGAFHLHRLTRECELSRSAVSVAPLVAQHCHAVVPVVLLGAPAFSRMVERAGRESKLGIEVHAHMLRHACGSRWRMQGTTPPRCKPTSGIGISRTPRATRLWRRDGSGGSGGTNVCVCMCLF
jgi:hypothetical protein